MPSVRKSRRKPKPSKRLLASRSPAVVMDSNVSDDEIFGDVVNERTLSPLQEEAAIDQEMQRLRLAAKKQELAELREKMSPIRVKNNLFHNDGLSRMPNISPAQLRRSVDVGNLEEITGTAHNQDAGTFSYHNVNTSTRPTSQAFLVNGGRTKSGRVENSTSGLFVVDVAWPHMYLGSRDITLLNGDKQIAYNNLDMRLLTVGELEIMALPSLSCEERQARSALLKDLLYYAGT